MTGKKTVSLRRRRGPGFWVVATVVCEAALRLVFESRWLDRQPVAQVACVALGGVVAVAGAVRIFVAYRAKRRDRMEKRATGRWPTGRPHVIALDASCNGTRVAASLVFEEGGLRVDPAPSLVPDVIPFADVAMVRVRPTWIEVETRRWTFRVVPASYEDRERLLWELALHCNAAVERGIDEQSKPSHAAAPANAAALDTPVTGLGSALAGPAQRPNPAPPRKSGLGNGLFVVRDGDGT